MYYLTFNGQKRLTNSQYIVDKYIVRVWAKSHASQIRGLRVARVKSMCVEKSKCEWFRVLLVFYQVQFKMCYDKRQPVHKYIRIRGGSQRPTP